MLLAIVFSVGHHVDHVVRGNHVGWPLIEQVTPFTYSFAVYPMILVGLFLSLRRRLGPGFWALLSVAGFLFVGLLHFGPFAVEPPADIIGPYASPWAGRAALGWLVLFLLCLAGTAAYSTVLWARARRSPHGRPPGQPVH